jgi:hypothetical protein
VRGSRAESNSRKSPRCAGIRARSSAGERSLHTREVAGSKPAVPIMQKPRISGVFAFRGRTSSPTYWVVLPGSRPIASHSAGRAVALSNAPVQHFTPTAGCPPRSALGLPRLPVHLVKRRLRRGPHPPARPTRVRQALLHRRRADGTSGARGHQLPGRNDVRQLRQHQAEARWSHAQCQQQCRSREASHGRIIGAHARPTKRELRRCRSSSRATARTSG